LGNYSYCGERTRLSKAVVGKFTCIGPGVQIGLGNHPVGEHVSIHPAFYSKAGQVGRTFVPETIFDEKPKATEIGNDVWIGANVIISGGVTIGNGAVIASGAVVTKDVLPYEVVGGIPAKKIRMIFIEDKVLFLQEFKWWEKTDEWLAQNASSFKNIETFISGNGQELNKS
jgi:acetyltransferase-like isoleucine patch superfamily enzyme